MNGLKHLGRVEAAGAENR